MLQPSRRTVFLGLMACSLFVSDVTARAEGGASLETVLPAYFGVADSSGPGRLRAAVDGPRSGEIWLVNLATSEANAIALENRYRSPIFMPNGDILALREETITRFSRRNWEPIALHRIKGLNKLVSASEVKPNHVLALAGDSDPVEVSVDEGKLAKLYVNRESNSDIKMLENLKGWSRNYGSVNLLVRKNNQGKTDVFMIRERSLLNITNCLEVDCGQPSMSFDQQLVVFAKGKSS